MGVLDLEGILNSAPLKHEDVPVPELGEGCIVRIMELDYEAGQELLFENYTLAYDDDGNKLGKKELVKAAKSEPLRALARSIVDDEGNRLYCAKLVKKLKAGGEDVIKRLIEVSNRLSKIGVTEDQEEEDIKN